MKFLTGFRSRPLVCHICYQSHGELFKMKSIRKRVKRGDEKGELGYFRALDKELKLSHKHQPTHRATFVQMLSKYISSGGGGVLT